MSSRLHAADHLMALQALSTLHEPCQSQVSRAILSLDIGLPLGILSMAPTTVPVWEACPLGLPEALAVAHKSASWGFALGVPIIRIIHIYIYVYTRTLYIQQYRYIYMERCVYTFLVPQFWETPSRAGCMQKSPRLGPSLRVTQVLAQLQTLC